jgi:hypothetical protein
MQVCGELELLSFFEGEPVEANPSDGFWRYAVEDHSGVKLDFSFNVFEKSVQVEIRNGDAVIALISREGASSLNVDSLNDVETINVRFESEDTKGHLMIRWRSGVFCEWSDVCK